MKHLLRSICPDRVFVRFCAPPISVCLLPTSSPRPRLFITFSAAWRPVRSTQSCRVSPPLSRCAHRPLSPLHPSGLLPASSPPPRRPSGALRRRGGAVALLSPTGRSAARPSGTRILYSFLPERSLLSNPHACFRFPHMGFLASMIFRGSGATWSAHGIPDLKVSISSPPLPGRGSSSPVASSRNPGFRDPSGRQGSAMKYIQSQITSLKLRGATES